MKNTLEGGDLVQIRINGKQHTAKVLGVLNKFPTVTVSEANYHEEFSQKAILRAINENGVLIG
jgi:hypothetical protein